MRACSSRRGRRRNSAWSRVKHVRKRLSQYLMSRPSTCPSSPLTGGHCAGAAIAPDPCLQCLPRLRLLFFLVFSRREVAFAAPRRKRFNTVIPPIISIATIETVKLNSINQSGGACCWCFMSPPASASWPQRKYQSLCVSRKTRSVDTNSCSAPLCSHGESST